VNVLRGRAATRLLVRVGVSAGLLVFLTWLLDVREVASRLTGLRPPWVLLALFLSVPQFAASAWRWRYTAARLGVDLPFGEALREYYLAAFINQVLPGGVVGDVSRAWRHARSRTQAAAPGGPAIRAVILERASGQLVMAFVAAGSFALLPMPLPPATRLLALLVFGVAGVVVVLGWRSRAGPTATHPPTARWTRLRRLLDDGRSALLGPALPVQLATSLFVVGSYLGTYLVAARAVGVETPTRVLLPLLAPVLLTMLVPATVAGWGLREAAAAALWSATGLGAVEGVVVSTAYGILVLVSTAPGALILLAEGRDRRGRPPPAGSDGSVAGAPDPGSRSA